MQNKEYFCPKHGHIKQSIIAIGSNLPNKEFLNIFCTYCFNEFLEQNIPVIDKETPNNEENNKRPKP